MYLTPKLSRMV